MFTRLFAVFVTLASLALASESRAPGATPAELQAFAHRAEAELRGNILPFWLEHTRDREHGGFFGQIDADLTVHPDAPRGVVLTARILWTFSAAYRRYRDPAYLEMARWAWRDLQRFQDAKFGGLFWTITPDGQPLEARKQIYGQVFGIYGLAEFYRATGEADALEQAITLYRLIERHAHDATHGGYCDAFTREWKPFPANERGLLGRNTPKSQNTHIHVMEAWTALLRVWPDPELKARQRELLELMLTKIVDPKSHHLVLFLGDDWTPLSDEISFGHDIELSWLLVEAAEVLGEPALLERAKACSLEIARVTNEQGVDRDGGLFNEANPHRLTNTNKDWWPQAEAVVGFLTAYQLSGERRWFEAAQRSWNFIDAKLVDRKNGEWFERVSREGVVIPGPKVSVWKCPYHNSRVCLELLGRIEALTTK